MIPEYEIMAGKAYQKYLFRGITEKQFIEDQGCA